MRDAYLDHAATTPLDPRVVAQMQPYFEAEFANPSSRHPPGVRAAEVLDRARSKIALALGVRVDGVLFTSGGTEAGNLAVQGLARAQSRHGKHILVGPTEHPCVRESALALADEGFEVEFLRLTPSGALDLDHAKQQLRPTTVVVAQMLVQNEFGSVYPVQQLARLARARSPNVRVFTDAVQALGKFDVSLSELGVHALSVSAHKVHGPKGSGVLALAPDVALRPLFFGGGQERALRPGTQNVAGNVGLGHAIELAELERPQTLARLVKLRAQLLAGASRLGLVPLTPHGGGGDMSPAINAFLLEHGKAEVVMHDLERSNVFVSAGSACQASKKQVSSSLTALGLDAERAQRMLRVSISKLSSEADVARLLDALEASLRGLGMLSR